MSRRFQRFKSSGKARIKRWTILALFQAPSDCRSCGSENFSLHVASAAHAGGADAVCGRAGGTAGARDKRAACDAELRH